MLKKIRVKPPFAKSKKTLAIKNLDHRHPDEHYYSYQQSLLVKGEKGGGGASSSSSSENESSTTTTTKKKKKKKIPMGLFAVYVGEGEGRERFMIPTRYLCHPLFKILLEKTYHEFGFEQKNGLTVSCTVSTFQLLLTAIQTNSGRFDIRILFQDYFIV